MKKFILAFNLLFPLFLFSQNSEIITLNDGWQFSQTDKDEWREAEVPGSIQRDLIRYKVLPDPYFGTNENEVQWPEKLNWDFKKTFTLTASQLKKDDAILFFEGLDTYADVFLNGSKILNSQNMFVGHKVQVKNLLREGENNLYIRFYSPIAYMMPVYLTNGFNYPADNDHSEIRMSVFSRKAPYHFGWDWGIRIVQMGIWKPVTLSLYDKARVDSYYVKQESITQQSAKIDNQVEVYSLSEEPVKAKVSIDYGIGAANSQTVESAITLNKGLNNVSIPLEITNPELWMPVGWGKPNLYNFKVSVIIDNKVIVEKIEQITFISLFGKIMLELIRENMYIFIKIM